MKILKALTDTFPLIAKVKIVHTKYSPYSNEVDLYHKERNASSS